MVHNKKNVFKIENVLILIYNKNDICDFENACDSQQVYLII